MMDLGENELLELTNTKAERFNDDMSMRNLMEKSRRYHKAANAVNMHNAMIQKNNRIKHAVFHLFIIACAMIISGAVMFYLLFKFIERITSGSVWGSFGMGIVFVAIVFVIIHFVNDVKNNYLR